MAWAGGTDHRAVHGIRAPSRLPPSTAPAVTMTSTDSYSTCSGRARWDRCHRPDRRLSRVSVIALPPQSEIVTWTATADLSGGDTTLDPAAFNTAVNRVAGPVLSGASLRGPA